MNLSSMTCERKFISLKTKEDFTLNWLKHACLKDPVYPVGFLNTLYYDTFNLDLYYEKVNGDYLKSKIRLRWYDEPLSKDYKNVFLEFKLRHGAARHKIRQMFKLNDKLDQYPDFDSSFFYNLLDDNMSSILERLPFNIMPLINIKYERDRFICPYSGARVCLDRNIRSSWINDKMLPYKKNVFSNYIVLEIKDAVITDIPWLDEIFHSGFRSQSFSKYGNLLDQIIEGS